jgi:hypothetical protein
MPAALILGRPCRRLRAAVRDPLGHDRHTDAEHELGVDTASVPGRDRRQDRGDRLSWLIQPSTPECGEIRESA